MARMLAVLTVAIASGLAAPSFAQPAPQPPPPPAAPGTVVIVSPDTPVFVGPPAPGPATAAPGQAQPMVPGAQPPPQNEPWSNVSNINGQVVKVGERGDYLYKWKTTSLAINPIGIIAGFYGVSLTQAIHPNVAIRGDANWISMSDGQIGHQFGLTVPIYLKRVFTGPFVEVGVVDRSEGCSGCQEEVGPEALFGWQWTFDSGFTVSAAAGALRDMNNMHDGNDGVDFDGYFRVGYAW